LLSWQLSLVFENELPPPTIISAAVITNNFCLSWTSLPASEYYVQAKTNLTDSAWTTASPPIIAADHQTTWCLPLPSAYHYFRLHQN
jgi:hypothetical protein